MLILHLIGEACRLEQTAAVPLDGGHLRGGGGQKAERRYQPLVDESQITACQDDALDVLDKAVVLGVKNAVDRCQGNVFIAAAITGDVVEVEQLIVIGARRLGGGGGTDAGVRIGDFAAAGVGVMGNVVEESVTGAQRIHRAHGGEPVALQQAAIEQHELGQIVGARDEVAVQVSQQEGHITDVGIGEVDAEQGAGLGFNLAPVGYGSGEGAIEKVAGASDLAPLQGVLAQEHLMGGMGCVGLVLVDPG